MIDYIKIEGFKSIQSMELELRPINVLIGANGSGKSNFISFFEFLNHLYNQKLEEYISLRGGQEKMLFQGSKRTEAITAHISFHQSQNVYSFTLKAGDEKMIFTKESLSLEGKVWRIRNYTSEAKIKEKQNEYGTQYFSNFKKYHFHDTSRHSPFTQMSHITNDSYFLYEEGKNLASILYKIQKNNAKRYNLITKTIQSIAPFFSDFYFHPNAEGYLRLQWQDKYSSTVYGASDLSDGTLRFMALTTLFMQPNVPPLIIIDEPELGLHPFAISKLGGMIQSAAARGTQIIAATQSPDLVSQFEPEDILTVDQINGATQFNKLDTEKLHTWLNEYSLGDLWQMSIIPSGHPNWTTL